MLSYFRLNDPFKVISVFILLLLFKLPILLAGEVLTIQELNWMLLGERLAQGKLIYAEAIDNTAPLSALVYWIIFSLFGKSWLALHIIAIFLICFQGFYLNQGFNKTRVFNEKTYVPLLIYVLFTMVSFDLSTLSPALMSVTFLTMTLKNILHLDSKSPITDLFKIGFYLGLSTLFYLPAVVFLPASILLFALFRTSSIRALLNIFSGFLLTIVLLLLFFIFQGNLGDFYRYFIKSIFLSKTWIYDINLLLYLFGFPLVVLLVSIVKLKTSRGFINYQQNSHWLIIIWTLFTFAALVISPKLSSTSIIIFAPVFSFFFSQFLLMQRKRWLAEVQLLVSLGIILSITYTLFFQIGTTASQYQNIVVDTKKEKKQQKIMILGNQIESYYGNTIASPFINWKISEAYVGDLDTYTVINFVKNSILEDRPELIIDHSENKISETIFSRIPLLYNYYDVSSDSSIIVYRQKNSTAKAVSVQ